MKTQTLFAAAGAVAVMITAGQASAQDWQGPYVGGFAGYGVLATEEDETIRFDTNLDGTFGDTVRTGAGADAFSPGFCDGSPNGNNAGPAAPTTRTTAASSAVGWVMISSRDRSSTAWSPTSAMSRARTWSPPSA